jgi:hypothetical protein
MNGKASWRSQNDASITQNPKLADTRTGFKGYERAGKEKFLWAGKWVVVTF